METLRLGSFETNSSSTHCLTVTNEERHESAFPKINPDGSIDIEAKHYWQCDGECDTVVLAEIIEYICMLGEACEQNLDSALKIVQQGYELAGKMPPDKINLYCMARDGSRVPYDDLFKCRAINGPERDWVDGKVKYRIYVPADEKNKARGFTHTQYAHVPADELDDFIARNPHLVIDPGLELKDAPILKHYVGVNPNDLTRETLEAALSNLATHKHYGGRKCSILDAFLYVSVLNFWHS